MTTPERIGMEKGLITGVVKGIEMVLKVRFGEEGLRLMPEIREIGDQAKLEAILNALETTASPQDLRRLWTQ